MAAVYARRGRLSAGKLRAASCGLRVAGCELRVVGCELRAVSFAVALIRSRLFADRLSGLDTMGMVFRFVLYSGCTVQQEDTIGYKEASR
jgi:hypothetical protein